MKPFTQLLSGLLVASVALLNSGAAWSDTQPNKSQAKSSAKAAQKKAKKSSHKAKPVAKAPGSAAQPATALNPYLPGAAAAPIVAKPNPYLPMAVPAAVPTPAASLALAKSLSLATVAASVPAVAKAATPEPVATPRANAAAAAPAPAAAAPAPVAVASAAGAAAPVAAAPAAVVAQAPQKAASTAKPAVNPYLLNSVAYNQPFTPISPSNGIGQVFSDFKLALPSLPTSDMSILPTIKKVQPTGEKPLYVLTFKCPTELVGIVPPPVKAVHWLVTAGMDGLNSSDLLPFNMQQVCQ